MWEYDLPWWLILFGIVLILFSPALVAAPVALVARVVLCRLVRRLPIMLCCCPWGVIIVWSFVMAPVSLLLTIWLASMSVGPLAGHDVLLWGDRKVFVVNLVLVMLMMLLPCSAEDLQQSMPSES